jgi:hypothetical protein
MMQIKNHSSPMFDIGLEAVILLIFKCVGEMFFSTFWTGMPEKEKIGIFFA